MYVQLFNDKGIKQEQAGIPSQPSTQSPRGASRPQHYPMRRSVDPFAKHTTRREGNCLGLPDLLLPPFFKNLTSTVAGRFSSTHLPPPLLPSSPLLWPTKPIVGTTHSVQPCCCLPWSGRRPLFGAASSPPSVARWWTLALPGRCGPFSPSVKRSRVPLYFCRLWEDEMQPMPSPLTHSFTLLLTHSTLLVPTAHQSRPPSPQKQSMTEAELKSAVEILPVSAPSHTLS